MMVAAAVLAACERAEDTLGTVRRVPLPDSLPGGATLAVDSAPHLWIGTPGRLMALDSAGRAVRVVQTPGTEAPRLLGQSQGRLGIAAGERVAVAAAGSARATGGWSSAAVRTLAADPRGAWVFAANRRGGVVGLDAATLTPAWGWPETGPRALAVAVSPLGDRVYVSVDEAEDGEPQVQVRDAATGRVLFRAEQAEALRALAAAPDGTLFGVADGAVVRLRHEGQVLRRLWSVSPGVGGAAELRMDPTGRRVAVLGRGNGATLAVLDAGDGRVLGQTKTAPLDAAFGVEGRLYLLERRSVRIVR
jgi:DNA-binding beta-propeller fold protein YncE